MNETATPLPLACPACDRTFEPGPGEPFRCECGGPLEFAERRLPDGRPPGSEDPPPKPADLDRDRGLWAFDAFLPVSRRATLGEGWTPLVEAGDDGLELNDGYEQNASFVLEYVSPTGSFKDRGAATTISRAVELGVERVLEDSSGNAGAAIATYAARAGIDAEIYVPADAPDAKLAAIERTGASVVRIEGSRRDVTDACVEAVERGKGWYASHAWNPAFYAGTATLAYEIAARRNWSAPDAIVAPIGHGTLFLGLYRGFRALSAAGWIDRVPRLLGVQAAGCAPIAEGLGGGDDGGVGESNEVADGIQIVEPVRRDEILAAIEETDGDAIAIGPDATERELRRLHRAGFHVEPTSAVAPAALRAYRERGVIGPEADVVVPLTGRAK